MPDRYEVGRKNKTVHSTVIDTRHNNCVLSAAVLAKRLNEAEATQSYQSEIINKLNFALDRVDGKMIAAQEIAREAQRGEAPASEPPEEKP
jgi:uncharacterized coiled-coil protein SlyX